MPEVDMSSEAIDQRLRDVGQLYRLGMSLKDVTILGDVEQRSSPITDRESSEGDRFA
jgi:hypothetical protein